MARDILDLGADVIDDTIVETKHRISPKKRNYIIGLSVTAALLAGAVTFTIIAANSWLLDVNNLNKMQFYFTPDNLLEEGEEQTLTLYKLDPEVKYPSTFRIPEKVQGYKVAHVADGAFSGHSEIKKVIFTKYVESIGKNAFSNCTNLESFTWNKKLNVIGENAFIGTKFLANLQARNDIIYSIPSGTLVYLGSNYFDDNTALVSNELSDAERQSIMTKYGITNNDFFSFADLGVTNIVDGVFANNNRISYIDFPSFLTKTGNKTFYSCSNLKGINFTHSKVTSIGESAFAGCEKLKDITFSEILTELGDNAFANTAIEEIPALHKVTSIGNGVFEGCESLETVIYPASETLTYVPEDMFKDCISLNEFYWGDTSNSGINYVNEIKIGAFANTAFTEFTVPKNVSAILDNTFEGCDELTTLKLYGNPTLKANYSYDENAYGGEWDYASGLTAELYLYDGEVTITSQTDGAHVKLSEIDGTYPGSNVEFVIPTEKLASLSQYQDNPVSDEELIDSIFTVEDASKYYQLDFTNDKSISVNIIGSQFYDEAGVAYPGELLGVKDIRSKAFNDNTKLKTISLYDDNGNLIAGKNEEGVFNLPLSLVYTNNDSYNYNTNYTFANTAVKQINIPANQATIGSYAFSGLTDLETVNFSANSHLTHIWSGAFKGDNSLTAINLPDSLQDIKPSVFADCTSLANIQISNTKIATINAETFLNCHALTSIELPSTVTGIKSDAFKGNYALEHVIIPSGIKEINKDSFAVCRNPEDLSATKMPIYLDLTLQGMSKVNHKEGWHDDTAFESYILAKEEAKIGGVSYWNGDKTSPEEIKVTGLVQNGTLKKTSYKAGEDFEYDGLTFTANYDDSTSINDVSNCIVWDELKAGDTSVTGSYTVGSVTVTITVNGITVSE